jgi:GntR family transcriptional regulator/MocR family aminotransferase
MKRSALALDLVGLQLKRDEALPMHRQIYMHIRTLILDGRLPPRTKLPSSRSLAASVGCSRMTTSTAYDLLEAEGYLEGLVGSGTYVADVLPESHVARNEAHRDGQLLPSTQPLRLSVRGARLAAGIPEWAASTATFSPGLPDTSAFPFDIWTRLFRRSWERPHRNLLEQAEPAGFRPLRAAIASQLSVLRGLQCSADEIVITSGATNALDVIARVLLDVGDLAWVEEPGYPDVIHTLQAAGVRCVPVPVDSEGLCVERGIADAADARLVWVTPSHQWPLGVTLSPKRRLALLDWAQQHDAIIIEDDYDSEFRYSGSSLTSLKSLDQTGQVIYLGSFSKTCFPSMRLGYMVLPRHLAPAFVRARQPLDFHSSYALQPVMAAFIADGHYDSHIRRMRKRYFHRQQALLAACERHLSDLLILSPAETGMAMVARFSAELARRMDDVEAARRALSAGLGVAPLSSFCSGIPPFPALLIGYARLDLDQVELQVQKLASVLYET